MTIQNRSFNRLIHPNFAILLLFLILGTVSCSSGNGGAVAPPVDSENRLTDNVFLTPGHNAIAYARIDINPDTWEINVIPQHTVENHLNLTAFLSHANCPEGGCMSWTLVDYDTDEDIYLIDVTVTNPTVYTAFDLRIILDWLPFNDNDPENILRWSVENPDSYTSIWDPDPEWSLTEQWLNPFIAFEKEDIKREFLSDPDGDGPTIYSDKERLILKIPDDSGWGMPGVILDASWPDHCKEPFEILAMAQSEDLPPNTQVSSVNFECVVADWQENTIDVDLFVEIYDKEFDPPSGVWYQMYEWPTSGDDAWPPGDGLPPFTDEEIQFLIDYGEYERSTLRRYWTNVYNEDAWGDLVTDVGDYRAIVRARSIDTDGDGNDKLYNIYPFEIGLGGSGGNNDNMHIIAFSSWRNGTDSDIYAYQFINNNPGVVTKLTDDGGVMSEELEPSIATLAGEQWLVFATNREQLPAGGIKGDFDIVMMKLQYNVEGQLINPNSYNFQPTPPDCEWIATSEFNEREPDINRSATDVAYTRNFNGQNEVYRWNPAGPITPQRITANYADDEAPHFDREDPLNVLWFHSDRSGGGNVEIYWINPINQESSFNLPTRITFHSGFDGYPASMGVGAPGISWTTDRLSPDPGRYDIFFYNFLIEPFSISRFEEDPVDYIDSFSSFSFDGTWVAFTSDRKNENIDIWRVQWDLGGGPVLPHPTNLTRVTNASDPDMDPNYGGGGP